jgi:hypothetical protein
MNPTANIERPAGTKRGNRGSAGTKRGDWTFLRDEGEASTRGGKGINLGHLPEIGVISGRIPRFP